MKPEVREPRLLRTQVSRPFSAARTTARTGLHSSETGTIDLAGMRPRTAGRVASAALFVLHGGPELRRPHRDERAPRASWRSRRADQLDGLVEDQPRSDL